MYYFKIKNNIKVPISKEIYSQINSIQNRTNYAANENDKIRMYSFDKIKMYK